VDVLWNLVLEKSPEFVAKSELLCSEGDVHSGSSVEWWGMDKDAVIGP
jgi:hypothetical protein